MNKVKNYRIITLCSSASFYKDVLDIEKKLRRMGFRVEVPSTAKKMGISGNFNVSDYKTWLTNSDDYYKKSHLMNEHFAKVVKADGIVVVNNEKNGIQGYIGGNVLMEMTLAYYHHIPIFLMNAISSKLAWREEILGLFPLIINGDLTKIIISEKIREGKM